MPKNYEQLLSKDMLAEYCLNYLLIIPYVEISISAQCTLNCKDCSNFMQYYDKPNPMNLENVLAWASAFIEAVDHIRTFRVMGGEPLMQKDLAKVLKFILDSPKVEHMQLVSNSTLIPKPEIISLLKNPKASIHLSNYGEKICPKHKFITDMLLTEGIIVNTTTPERKWVDDGDTSVRTTDITEIKARYKKCMLPCKHIWNGELHVCPRSAHGRALGMIHMKSMDYVNLLDTSVEERRKQIRALHDVDYIDACACCDRATGKMIRSGLQGETIKYKMVAQ